MLHAPPQGFQDELRGAQFVDAKQFPAIAFKSTAITMTGPNTADVTGDLTLHGVTRPITLSATYNGGYEGHAYEPMARIGFSAKGVFKRSDFGIGYGLPAEGSNMGASDDVSVVIEAEFTGPPVRQAASSSAGELTANARRAAPSGLPLSDTRDPAYFERVLNGEDLRSESSACRKRNLQSYPHTCGCGGYCPHRLRREGSRSLFNGAAAMRIEREEFR